MRFGMLTLALAVLAGMAGFAHAQNQPEPGKQPPATLQPGNQPPPNQQPGQTADPKLVKEATAILQTYCARCHGPGGTNEGGFNYLFTRSRLIEKKKLVPGDLVASAKRGIWERIQPDGGMPPEGQKQPSEKERQIIGEWIKAGAQFADPGQAPGRQFVSLEGNLQAIHDHLANTNPPDQKFIRYFSLVNLYNSPSVSEGDLQLARAGLSKAINSLSWQNNMVLPQPVDKAQTIYAIDLRHLNWDRNNMWSKILSRYPYGLTFQGHPNRKVAFLDQQINQLSGATLPWIRGDWFIACATRPPLYHAILQLPKTAGELEKKLGVDFAGDFMRNQLWRAGFTKSGVSTQNRLVERHRSSFGSYWKSYDFKKNSGRGDLYRFPLGPQFPGNPYNDSAAFQQDGGEMIFSLPNGLQGYYLTDGKGNRIDEGPIDVVRDSTHTSGHPTIVNGLSCMNCHNKGMLEFTDTLPNNTAVVGDLRDKLRDLHPAPEQMKQMVQEDTSRFMKAYEQVGGQILKVGPDSDKDIGSFQEPIGVTARRYTNQELDAPMVAAELGLQNPAQLQQVGGRLRELGLLPLINGGTIKREAWDSMDRGRSAFQIVASELDLGRPKVVSVKLEN